MHGYRIWIRWIKIQLLGVPVTLESRGGPKFRSCLDANVSTTILCVRVGWYGYMHIQAL